MTLGHMTIGHMRLSRRGSMDDLLTISEAFEILKEQGITDSIDMVRRWIRQGKLKAMPFNKNRREGYRIAKSELELFVQLRRPELGLKITGELHKRTKTTENRTVSVKLLYDLRDNIQSGYWCRNHVWDIKMQASYIDSILKGYAITPILLHKKEEDGNYLIIDGKQRLLTLWRYIENSFKIPESIEEINRNIAGKFFCDLDDKDRLDFLNSTLFLAILNNYSEDELGQMFVLWNMGK